MVSIMGADETRAGMGSSPRLGWLIVAGLFAVEFTIFGVTLYAFVTISPAMAASFNWSPTQVGALVSAMWLAAPLALFAAPLIERFGAWRLVVGGLCLQALAVLLLVAVDAYWQLYLLRVAMGVGKVMAISSLPAILGRWFSGRFATAIAIVWAGSSAGGILLSPIAEATNTQLGWRPTVLIFGGVLVVVAAIVSLIGRAASSPPGNGATDAAGPAAAQASRWAIAVPPGERLLAGLMFLAVVGAGMGAIGGISLAPRLAETVGHSPATSALLLALAAGAGMVGSASAGGLIDRFRLSWVSAAVSGTAYAGLGALVLLIEYHLLSLAVIGVLCLGYALGAIDVVWINLTKRQFGSAAFAVTYGGWYFALQLGYALGGGLGGWSFEQFGPPGLLIFLALAYLPAALLGVRPPRNPSQAPHAQVDSPAPGTPRL